MSIASLHSASLPKPGASTKARNIKTSRFWDLLLLVVGLSLFAALIKFCGAKSIAESFQKIGWRIAPLVLLYGIWQLSFAYAWTFAFVSRPQNLPFWKIFGIYLVGDAINYCVPSGNLAGEPVKPYLIKFHMPVLEGLASVLINKLAETISMVLFLTLGVLLGLFHLKLPLPFKIMALVVYTGTAVAVSLFFWRQQKGLAAPIARFLSKLPFLRSFLVEKESSAGDLDKIISEYYVKSPGRFCVSVFFNLLGWFGGAVELTFILYFLGLGPLFLTAIAIEAFSVLVNNLFFFLPGRIGGGETGKVAIFSAIGLGAATGLSFGIIRRIRELFWVGIGFLFLTAWRVNSRLRQAIPS